MFPKHFPSPQEKETLALSQSYSWCLKKRPGKKKKVKRNQSVSSWEAGISSLVYIWFIHRFRHFYYIHIHQNACWKVTQTLNTACVFPQETAIHIRQLVQWLFILVELKASSEMPYGDGVVKFPPTNMWVNFIPDSLFIKKYVRLRDYY